MSQFPGARRHLVLGLQIIMNNILNDPLIFMLMKAIIMVESGNDPAAIGDSGQAYGCMQIHAILVRDVNRIANTSYVHEDAFDEDKSRRMFYEYSKHYARRLQVLEGRPPTFEDIARNWNGGPDGFKKECSKPYWGRVQLALESLISNGDGLGY